MAPHHFAFMVLICMIWGFNFVAAKVGVAAFDPFLFTGLRFALVAVLMAPFLRWHEGRMWEIFKIAIFAGALHFGLMFVGISFADASVAGVIAQLNVPFVTILSIVFLGEVVRWKRWSGIALAFAGTLVIGLEPRVLAEWEGVAAISCGALSIAFAMMLMKRIKDVPVFSLQGWIAVISAPLLLTASWIAESGQGTAMATAGALEWGTVAYVAVGASIIGHGGFYWLLQKYDASHVGPLTLMAPVVAVISGVLVLGEPLTGRFMIGAALTLAGVGLIAARQVKRSAAVAERGDQAPLAVPAQMPARREAAP